MSASCSISRDVHRFPAKGGYGRHTHRPFAGRRHVRHAPKPFVEGGYGKFIPKSEAPLFSMMLNHKIDVMTKYCETFTSLTFSGGILILQPRRVYRKLLSITKKCWENLEDCFNSNTRSYYASGKAITYLKGAGWFVAAGLSGLFTTISFIVSLPFILTGIIFASMEHAIRSCFFKNPLDRYMGPDQQEKAPSPHAASTSNSAPALKESQIPSTYSGKKEEEEVHEEKEKPLEEEEMRLDEEGFPVTNLGEEDPRVGELTQTLEDALLRSKRN